MAWLIIPVLQPQDLITGKRQSQRSHFTSVKEKLPMPLGKSELTFAFLLLILIKRMQKEQTLWLAQVSHVCHQHRHCCSFLSLNQSLLLHCYRQG